MRQRDRPVDGLVDEGLEVVEAEGLADLAAERVDAPERGDQQDRERAEVADDQPADRAGEQGADLQPGAAMEEVGEPAAHRPLRRRRASAPAASTDASDYPLISVQAETQSL